MKRNESEQLEAKPRDIFISIIYIFLCISLITYVNAWTFVLHYVRTKGSSWVPLIVLMYVPCTSLKLDDEVAPHMVISYVQMLRITAFNV